MHKEAKNLVKKTAKIAGITCVAAGAVALMTTGAALKALTEGVTNHDIQPLIVDEIAEITRGVAAERGYTLIDIHALTAQHPEWFEKNGVHPSNEGATAIAREVYTVISSK